MIQPENEADIHTSTHEDADNHVVIFHSSDGAAL